MTLKLTIAIGLAIAAGAVSAQDVPTPYESSVSDYGQLQLQSTLAKRRLQQAQARRPNAAPVKINARSRALCRDKRNVGARLAPARARQLYALSARAGY